jgi:methionyl-tRNA formyltransferase
LYRKKNKELFLILSQYLAGSNIDIITINKKNFSNRLKELIAEKKANSCWLMTFPYIIPFSLLQALPGIFINFHYGILPKFRGPNPILAQMLQYETHSGITVHFVDEKIDNGPMILQQKIPIEDTDSFGLQCRKLGILGASMALQLIKMMSLGPDIPSRPQDESQANYFKKPIAAELMINWKNMSSKQVCRLINACNPWNKGAGAIINNQVICITDAEVTSEIITGELQPGTIIGLDATGGLKVLCSDKIIIRVNIIYTPDGFFTGHKLSAYGIKLNDRFTSQC